MCGTSRVAGSAPQLKPFLKFERLLETYLAFAPRGFNSFATSLPLWIKEKLFQKKLIINKLLKILPNKNLIKDVMVSISSSEHHSFSIPLEVSINSGNNWGEAH